MFDSILMADTALRSGNSIVDRLYLIALLLEDTAKAPWERPATCCIWCYFTSRYSNHRLRRAKPTLYLAVLLLEDTASVYALHWQLRCFDSIFTGRCSPLCNWQSYIWWRYYWQIQRNDVYATIGICCIGGIITRRYSHGCSVWSSLAVVFDSIISRRYSKKTLQMDGLH